MNLSISFIFHTKVFTMRINFVVAALLFPLPSNICGSNEDKNSKNLTNIDVSDEQDIEHDDKTSGPVVNREAAVLTDDIF